MKIRVIYPTISIVLNDTPVVVAGCRNCSFSYVASLFKKYVKLYYNVNYNIEYSVKPNSRLLISDLWRTLEGFNQLLLPSKAVLWIDTAWISSNTPIPENAKKQFVITTSQWNAKILKNLGIRHTIVPRAIDDEYAKKYFNPKNNRRYDFVLLATSSLDDHKNVKLALKVLKDLGELERSYLICDLPQCNAKPFSLTEDGKFQILSQSKVFVWLSENEGFGLPPVEAMSVGTPVIHFDSEYVREPMEGTLSFKIPVYGFVTRESPTAKGKYFARPVYDYDEVVKMFKEALSTSQDMAEEERAKLHEHVMSKFSHKVILPQLKNYLGGSFK